MKAGKIVRVRMMAQVTLSAITTERSENFPWHNEISAERG